MDDGGAGVFVHACRSCCTRGFRAPHAPLHAWIFGETQTISLGMTWQHAYFRVALDLGKKPSVVIDPRLVKVATHAARAHSVCACAPSVRRAGKCAGGSIGCARECLCLGSNTLSRECA